MSSHLNKITLLIRFLRERCIFIPKVCFSSIDYILWLMYYKIFEITELIFIISEHTRYFYFEISYYTI